MLTKKHSRVNILISYAYLRSAPAIQEFIDCAYPYCNILIDSGAFSNFWAKVKSAKGQKTGKPVTLDEYISYIKTNLDKKVWQYIALDVAKDAKASNRNLAAMVDAGLTPMPVYVEGNSADDVSGIMQINKRVCVAGGVSSNDHYIRNRYKTVYEASDKTAKIHGLGFGRFPDIFCVPIRSDDSSTFATGSRFGNVCRYSKVSGFVNGNWKLLKPDADPKKRSRESLTGL